MKIQYQSSNLTIFESALFRTTTTVFINDDLILVVDPNWLPQEINEIKDFVEESRKEQPLYLLFTHSDYDHIIGYNAFPEAKTIASKAFQDNPSKEESIQSIQEFDDQYYISRDYSIEYPKVDIAIEKDEEGLEIGNTSLIFYQAKGHNPDGIFTIIKSQGIWIAGDYLSNIEFPYIYHSSSKYLETLSKVETILEKHGSKIINNRTRRFYRGYRRNQKKNIRIKRIYRSFKEIHRIKKTF